MQFLLEFEAQQLTSNEGLIYPKTDTNESTNSAYSSLSAYFGRVLFARKAQIQSFSAA